VPEDYGYIMTVDEGTTSVRSMLWDRQGNQLSSAQREITQLYPSPGWVEHDPSEIWRLTLESIKACMSEVGVSAKDLKCIGVTNQRETTILWERRSGNPVHNAIVWQDRRTAELVEEIKRDYEDLVREKTGLTPDSYFSAVKVKWLLDRNPDMRDRALRGELCFGTVDSYLIWKLSGGTVYVTDYSNASRTMLFNIRDLDWDSEIFEILKIPAEISLPEVKPSSYIYGYTDPEILGVSVPISGDAGDQQAALFGEACFREGMVKATYGTGSFVLMNTGRKPCRSSRLLTTIAWGLREGEVDYALEGSIFITGAAVQWLRDEIKLISSSSDIERLARSVSDNAGVYFVPAFVGLGAPHWDQYARGLLIGITRGTGAAHICRAVLESIAYQVNDVTEVMEEDSLVDVSQLRVDGGASKNDFLMQFQADITGVEVVRPKVTETTSLGVAYLAGLGVGIWSNLSELSSMWTSEMTFNPSMSEDERKRLLARWKEALKRSMGWARV
jgi:glycerol kinase